MCKLTGGKINPLIGSAGVSAVPMAARVSQKEAQRENPGNFLLMHAMGPNVAGVIGSAVAAGVFIALFNTRSSVCSSPCSADTARPCWAKDFVRRKRPWRRF